MNKIVLSILLQFSFLCLKSQISSNQIVGTWQIKSAQVSSALHENYRFFADGTFIYYFDSYDEAKRIISVRGTYKIDHDKIIFKILSRKEIVGGKIIKASEGFQKGWTLFGGDVTEIQQTDSEEESCVIKTCSSEKSMECIKIDNESYFKVSENPDFK